jgi:hypothetical protein
MRAALDWNHPGAVQDARPGFNDSGLDRDTCQGGAHRTFVHFHDHFTESLHADVSVLNAPFDTVTPYLLEMVDHAHDHILILGLDSCRSLENTRITRL